MTSLLQPYAAAPHITAIARMLGKAVKVRHCPATVSAPASPSVIFCDMRTKEDLSQGLPHFWDLPFQPLELDR
jgi:hypothetical protein